MSLYFGVIHTYVGALITTYVLYVLHRGTSSFLFLIVHAYIYVYSKTNS